MNKQRIKLDVGEDVARQIISENIRDVVNCSRVVEACWSSSNVTETSKALNKLNIAVVLTVSNLESFGAATGQIPGKVNIRSSEEIPF